MKLPLPLICLIFVCSLVSFAQTERDQGIAFYNKSDFKSAAQILNQATRQNKMDADAWYYLGLSLLQTQDLKEGAKALEQAAKLKPQEARFIVGLSYAAFLSGKLNEAKSKAEKALVLDPKQMQAYYFLSAAQRQQGLFKPSRETADRAIRINPDLPDFYWMKVLATFAEAVYTSEVRDNTKLLGEVKRILESYPKLADDTEGSRFIREKLNNLEIFSEAVKNPSNFSPPTEPPPPDPDSTPLKILSKPRPGYTEAGRRNQAQGVVRIVLLFASNGTVEYGLPLNVLKFGLTAEAMNAAYQIKFEPATKNGKPISVVKHIEYSFSVY